MISGELRRTERVVRKRKKKGSLWYEALSTFNVCVTQRWIHMVGSTNIELQTHGIWNSQWKTVRRSGGQEFPHLLLNTYVHNRVQRAGQFTLPAATQIPLTTHCSISFLVSGATAQWARASSLSRFLDHTRRRSTVRTTTLDEWSAGRTDLYLTTHDTHNRQKSVHPVAIELTTSAAIGRRHTP